MGLLSCLQSIITIAKNGIDVGYFLHSHLSFHNQKITHYFENYHKHVTIYGDGTGIVINEFDMVFNKKEKTFLKRGIDISDGNDAENITLKNNNKILRWIFDLNYSRIYPNKKYKVIYVMSIPGMYPIKNGKLDIASINDEQLLNNLESGSSTSIRITNPIRNFHYTISFESDILLEREPQCLLKHINQQENITHPKLKHEYNTIYNKYTCNITKPKIGSIIKINWQFKEESL